MQKHWQVKHLKRIRIKRKIPPICQSDVKGFLVLYETKMPSGLYTYMHTGILFKGKNNPSVNSKYGTNRIQISRLL